MKKSFLWSLFGVPFACVGLFALGVAAWGAWDAFEMQSWKELSATLLSLELEMNQSDDSTTHRIRARYRYADEGRTHESERVAIYSFADNIGDFHVDLYAELKRAFDNDRQVTAYVDPDDFTKSVLSRDPRWGLTALLAIFGLVFAGAGVAVTLGTLFSKRQQSEKSDKQNLHPEEPWRWREDWHNGVVQSAGSANVFASIVFTAVWLMVSSPASFLVPAEVRDGNYLALIALAFPIVGLLLIIRTYNEWVRARRFGVSTITLQKVPIPIGGDFNGEIKVNAPIPVATHFIVRLSCIEVRRRPGKRNSRTEHLLWQDELSVPRHDCQLGPTSSTIPFGFALPGSQPGTRDAGDGNEILWRIDASAECPGADYVASFVVPVYAVGTPAVIEPEPAQDYARALGPGRLEELRLRGIRVDSTPEGAERWTFGRARHKGAAFALTIFALIWSAFVAFIYSRGAPIWFVGIFGAVAVLLLWSTVHTWLSQQRVVVNHLGIALSSGIILAGRLKQYAWAEIADIKPVRGMSAGNKLYYDLKLETGDRVLPIAARSIDNLKTAEDIVASWERFKT